MSHDIPHPVYNIRVSFFSPLLSLYLQHCFLFWQLWSTVRENVAGKGGGSIYLG